MNRSIIFRGKRVDTKEWVFGGVWVSGANDFYIIDSVWLSRIRDKGGRTSYGFEDEKRLHWVNRDTVGQFTGNHYKDGRCAYEGDIFRCTKGCNHTIEFVQEYGGTYIGGMPAFYPSGLREGYAWTGEEEFVGIIHDNPELKK